MAFDTGGRDGFKAEINVTPLVDVVLVLLIIFMVVTPLLSRGRDVDLPRAQSAAARQPTEPGLVLSVAEDGGTWLDSRKVSEAELVDIATERKARARYLEVLIRADSRMSVKMLRPLLRALKQAGVTQISFAALDARGAP